MSADKAFHAHLDECSRCREQPFDLCDVGDSLLKQTTGIRVVTVTPVEPAEETAHTVASGSKDRVETMLEEAVAGLSPLARALKLEVIALGVATPFEGKNDHKRAQFWRDRAREAHDASERIAREAAAKGPMQ